MTQTMTPTDERLRAHNAFVPSDNSVQRQLRLRQALWRERTFVGLEVKYAENMQQPPARHRARYEVVADAMGVFVPEARPRLRDAPLEQLWRDHLLAGSMLLDEASGFARGAFAVVYPSENVLVASAVQAYRGCLRDDAGFRAWTLEELLDVLARCGGGAWALEVRERYLGAGEA